MYELWLWIHIGKWSTKHLLELSLFLGDRSVQDRPTCQNNVGIFCFLPKSNNFGWKIVKICQNIFQTFSAKKCQIFWGEGGNLRVFLVSFSPPEKKTKQNQKKPNRSYLKCPPAYKICFCFFVVFFWFCFLFFVFFFLFHFSLLVQHLFSLLYMYYSTNYEIYGSDSQLVVHKPILELCHPFVSGPPGPPENQLWNVEMNLILEP